MGGHSKLFLAKTHTALQNLKRRIDNPGPNHQFMSLDSYIRRKNPEQFSIIFVDECSIIDNRSMLKFIRLLPDNAFLVLAGDIHQIESIEFRQVSFAYKDIPVLTNCAAIISATIQAMPVHDLLHFTPSGSCAGRFVNDTILKYPLLVSDRPTDRAL